VTRSRAKRRPQTRVARCLSATFESRDGKLVTTGGNGSTMLHLLLVERRAPELDATVEELANDSVAILTGGEQGRYLGHLAPRAVCGARVRELVKDAGAVLGCDRKCPGCFGGKVKR
jgi:hypothetical protein